MASKDDSEEQLIKKIQAGELTECEPAKLKLKSNVYSSFTLIFDKNKEVYQGYVRCKVSLCGKLVKHDLHKSGTSHLQKHIISAPATHGKMKSAPAPQQKMTGFITQRKMISDCDKAELRSAMSYYCSADLRPFFAIEGKGFEKIAQVFIQLGAKYGNIRAEDVIPSRTTVSEFCQAEATADRQMFVKDLNDFIVRHGMVGVTTDMWQDSFKKKSYVALTVHMIQYGRLISRLLQVSVIGKNQFLLTCFRS